MTTILLHMFHRRFLRLVVPLLPPLLLLVDAEVRPDFRVSVFFVLLLAERRVVGLPAPQSCLSLNLYPAYFLPLPSSGSGVGVALEEVGEVSRLTVRDRLAGGGDGEVASAVPSCRCSDMICSYSSSGKLNSCVDRFASPSSAASSSSSASYKIFKINHQTRAALVSIACITSSSSASNP